MARPSERGRKNVQPVYYTIPVSGSELEKAQVRAAAKEKARSEKRGQNGR